MEVEVEAASGSASESRWSKLGVTLPARNVQALAEYAGELTADTIERYIRPDIDALAVLPEYSDEVPVIDLGKLLSSESVEAEAAKLRLACEEWGFFQVVNHGISYEVIMGMKHDIQKFFKLPLDVKNAYAQRLGDRQGYGQAFVVSDDQKLDWADMFALFTQPPQARDMSYWPCEPQTFRNSIEEYSSEVMKLAHSLAIFIAKTLDVDPELVEDKNVTQFLMMSYYPPCTSMPEKIMMNGKYKSIEHRVTINAYKERLTVSAFHVPKYDEIISPVLGNSKEKLLYKTVKVEDYARPFSQTN